MLRLAGDAGTAARMVQGETRMAPIVRDRAIPTSSLGGDNHRLVALDWSGSAVFTVTKRMKRRRAAVNKRS